MKLRLVALLLAVPALAGIVRAQDATAIWSGLSEAPFDTSKYATVENVTITKDRIHITLKNGAIQFTQAANGLVYGAAFEGTGRVEIDPPNALEAQQVRRFTGKDRLDMDFSSAAFSFTDDTFDQLSSALKWTAAQGGDHLA